MKITAVRLIEGKGTMTYPGVFWEERLVRPMDIYPEHKAEGAGWLQPGGEGQYQAEPGQGPQGPLRHARPAGTP